MIAKPSRLAARDKPSYESDLVVYPRCGSEKSETGSNGNGEETRALTEEHQAPLLQAERTLPLAGDSAAASSAAKSPVLMLEALLEFERQQE